MKVQRVLPVLVICLSLAAGAVGCSSEDEEGLKYTPKPEAGAADAAPDLGPKCGPKTLCERSINECKAELTQAACEQWYVDGECKDMTAYTSCNCGCIGKNTCDDYFSCGEICFADHCK